jgi:TctA family transporter
MAGVVVMGFVVCLILILRAAAEAVQEGMSTPLLGVRVAPVMGVVVLPVLRAVVVVRAVHQALPMVALMVVAAAVA